AGPDEDAHHLAGHGRGDGLRPLHPEAAAGEPHAQPPLVEELDLEDLVPDEDVDLAVADLLHLHRVGSVVDDQADAAVVQRERVHGVDLPVEYHFVQALALLGDVNLVLLLVEGRLVSHRTPPRPSARSLPISAQRERAALAPCAAISRRRARFLSIWNW